MSLLGFLGLGSRAAGRDAEPDSLIELSHELESWPPEDARLVAAFAYLLARIAGADLRVDDLEHREIARHLERFAKVESGHAELLARSALRIAEANSSIDDHLVARAFRDMTEAAERLRLIRCLYAVAAADDSISTREDNEIFEVAAAIGIAREQVVALRSEFKQYLGSMRALDGER